MEDGKKGNGGGELGIMGQVIGQVVALPDGKIQIQSNLPPIDLAMVLSDLLSAVVRQMREEGIKEAQRIKLASGADVMRVMKGGRS